MQVLGYLSTISLAVGLIALWPVASPAQTAVNYTFEDGQLRGNPTSMRVPPKILQEGGNHFMRITGSTGDCESLPDDLCPPKNRSTVEFTSHSQPYITTSNQQQLYSAKLRFHGNSGYDGVVFELFQDAVELGGYGTRDGQGPVFRFWRFGGTVEGCANYANETKCTEFSFGFVPAGQWHTYTVAAVWSHDPSQGRIEVFMDGDRTITISGRDVNLGPSSKKLPSFKLGMYGDLSTGMIDVDDVIVGPGSGGVPDSSSPPTLPPPTNLRIVER